MVSIIRQHHTKRGKGNQLRYNLTLILRGQAQRRRKARRFALENPKCRIGSRYRYFRSTPPRRALGFHWLL